MESVPLLRYETRLFDEFNQPVPGESGGGGGACLVGDTFFYDGPFQIISAEVKGRLGQLRPQHHPVGLDMINVVQDQPGRGDGF